jgi:hypothetical protein
MLKYKRSAAAERPADAFWCLFDDGPVPTRVLPPRIGNKWYLLATNSDDENVLLGMELTVTKKRVHAKRFFTFESGSSDGVLEREGIVKRDR